MTSRRTTVHRAAMALAAIVLAATVPTVVSVPGAGAAAAPAPSSATTSAPTHRSVRAQDRHRLSGRLLALAAQAEGSATEPVASAQNRIAGTLPTGAGSLNRAEGGRLVVNARLTRVDAETERALRATGARVAARSVEDHLVTLTVRARQLADIAAVPGVEHVEEVLTPSIGSVDTDALRTALNDIGPITNATCPSGVISEGDAQLGAATARSTYGVTGAGVRVGILSDSFNSLNGAAADVLAGELPGATNPCGHLTPVTVQSEKPTAGTDEGRAMAQIVHDLAPGASISFASGVVSDVDFANQIRSLADNGARVIVDDISYLDEPMYQDGIIAKAINDVSAQGVLYLSSAGNANVVSGGVPIGSYEATAYRPTTCPAALAAFTYADCHDFDPGAGFDPGDTMVIGNGGQLLVRLGWNEPSYGIATNYDLWALDASSGGALAVSNDVNPTSNKKAYEALALNNTSGASRSYRLVVARKAGVAAGTPRFKLYLGRSKLLTSAQYTTSSATDIIGPSSYGHNMTPAMASVAATAYNSGTAPETFSSRGPALYCWAPVNGIEASAALPSCVSDTIDVAATDGAANSFFGQVVSSVWRFYGTSAAAPHAAAVAALAIEARYCAVGTGLVGNLRSGATAMPGQPADAVGGGLANASGTITNIGACSGAPTAPRNVVATPGPTSGTAVVSWTAPFAAGTSAITAYRVTPHINGVAQTATTFNSTATTQTVTGLSNGTAYTFTVQAQNGTGFGPAAAPSNSAVPRTTPGAPTGVIGTPGNTTVAVQWTAPGSNGGSAITGYQVTPYVGAAPESPRFFNSTLTQQTITGLANGTAYTFRVAAINAAGTGTDSTASSAVTPRTVPAAPTNVAGIRGDSQVALTWTDGANNGAAITDHQVTPYIGGVAQTPVLTGSGSSFGVVTGLVNGTAYTFTVKAINAAGASGASAASAAYTPVGSPGLPTGVTGTAGDSQVALSWTAPTSDGGSPITGYTVTPYIVNTPQTPQTFNSPATSQTVTGLANGVGYTFKVEALNIAGTSGQSNPSAVLTPVGLATAPSGVAGTRGDTTVALSWVTPASDGGSPIIGYRIVVLQGGTPNGSPIDVGVVNGVIVGGLVNGTAYTFTVAARSALGTGPASAPSAPITPATTPGAPTGIGILPTDGGIQASWTAPSSTGGSPLLGYRVKVITSGADTLYDFPSLATTQVITGLTNGVAYSFQVLAWNDIGFSLASAQSAIVTAAAVPGSPTAVTATASAAGASVSWTAPASIGGSAITGYRVTPVLAGVAQTPQAFTSTDTTQLVTGLNAGASYRFRVAAINGQGTGLDSDLSATVATNAAWSPFASWNALVTQLYTDLLGRAPTATELTNRVAALNAKTLTPGGLVAALRTDTDHVNNVDPVTRLYRAYFLRIPDRPGLTYWIGKKRSGTSISSISSTFANSTEFKNRYGTLTNQQFVELVYTNVLGRPGDSGGISYWTGQLDTGKKTRGQVMVGFSESNEFKTKQANKVTVSVLYILLLVRAPSTTEFTNQVAALDAPTKTVTRLATELLASSTYLARFP